MAMLLLLSACSEIESITDGLSADESSIIHVGGIDNSAVETSLGGYTSRAAGDNVSVDAETIDWLLGPLFGGLDITYGAKNQPSTEKVAILRLEKKDPAGGNTRDNIKYSDYSTETEKIAEYSFKYRTNNGGEGSDAVWYDNGLHYFQGVFVPDKLRYKPADSETLASVSDATSGKAPNLKLDQSKDSSTSLQHGLNHPDANYTLLERYLGMPADAYLHATVGRIKLPFRHRLARVLAYVLIDPTMGSDVTIEGYKTDKDSEDNLYEDATTSSIRFCNVKVLVGVKEEDDAQSGHATLTPQWDQARKVIPHFVDEFASVGSDGVTKDEDNFIMYYNTELKTYIFPSNDEAWAEARGLWDQAYTAALGGATDDAAKREAANKADKDSGYKRTLYGKVPCYDLIVRPTYKTEEMVMYDEADVETKRSELASQKNAINFEITLNNGLEYYKEFEFDLDANYQTIVYLRINRESIDYNSSGAEVWDETADNDGYYGVNNLNGNTLSYAGSSWQRAYRIGAKDTNVTDGHWYGKDDTTDDNGVQDDDAMPWYPQYVDQQKWIEMFAEAHEGGLHHGDYFILDRPITIDAKALPANFVFTGHLDGQDHTITLTGMGETVVDQPAWYEDHYVNEEISPAVKYTQAEIDAAKDIVKADGYVQGTNPEAEIVATKTTEDIKTAAQYGDVNHPIHHDAVTHTSGSTLFAGLNGAYDAAVGQANVHKENGIFVPYVDRITKTGWRAEVINTKIAGADMFPDTVFDSDGTYDVSKVSGYVYNCWKDGNKIKPHTPTLPKYN